MPNNKNKFCDANQQQQDIELRPSDMHVPVIWHFLVDEALPVIKHLLVDEASLVALALGEEGAALLLQLLGGLGQTHPHNGVTGDQGLQLVLSPPFCPLRPQWNGQEPASQPAMPRCRMVIAWNRSRGRGVGGKGEGEGQGFGVGGRGVFSTSRHVVEDTGLD